MFSPFATRLREPARPALDWALLEDRVLMSATPLGDLAAGQDPAMPPTDMPAQTAAAFDSPVDAADEGDAGSGFRFSDASPRSSQPGQTPEAVRMELVFADTGTADYEQLVNDILRNAIPSRELEVYLLDPHRDGIEQISGILAGYSNLDAIHLVSHGTDGQLQLGGTWLNGGNLAGYAGGIAGWNAALRDGGDLLIYGCDFAANDAGRMLAESLSALTGTDVAASTNATGHVRLAGDWELEFQTGEIETASLLGTAAQADWRHTLGPNPPVAVDDGYSVDEDNTLNVPAAGVLANDTDADSDPLTAILAAGPANAAAFVLNADGSFSYTPNANFNGIDNFTYYADDGTNNSNLATVTITVDAVNDGPLNSVPGVQATPQDSPLTFNSANGNVISISDIDAGGSPVQVTLTATNGTVTLGGPSNTATATGGEARVNSTTGNDQATVDGGYYGSTTNDFGTNRAVATDPSGNYVVTWSSKNQDGHGWGIYAQRYNSAGVAQGGEFRVNNTTNKDQVHSSVAMDDAGNFAIVWSSKDTDGSNWGVYARRYNAAGTALGNEFQVNTYTNKEQLGASIAMDDAGNFVVTWSSKDQDGDNWGVYAKRFDAAGTVQGGEFRVNSTTAKDQTASSVAMSANGTFVVTWSSKDQDGDNWGIYGKRYDASGIPQGTEFLVNSATAKEQEFSSVAMDADGNFVVTWSSKDQDGDNWGVYAQRYNAAGVAQGTEFLVNLTTSKEQIDSSVAVGVNGDFVITWTSHDQDGDKDGVYARQYTSAGAAKGGETLVNTTTAGEQRYSSVAMNAGGGFVVVWTGNGPGDGFGVFSQRFTVPSGLVFTVGDGTRDTTMTFTGTLAQVNAVLDGLVFTPNTGFNGLATVTVATNDLGNTGSGGAQSDSDVININVGGSNVAPTLTLSGGTLNYTELDPATVIDGGAGVSDPDSTDFDTGQLTVFFSGGGTDDDRLAIRDQGLGPGQIGLLGANVTYGGIMIGVFTGGSDASTPLVVTLNANATPSAVEALARNITFQNVSATPSTLPRTVRFQLSDGDGGTSSASTNITVTAINNAPLGTGESHFVNEDSTLNVAAAGVLLNDLDLDGDPLSAVLATDVSNGVLSLNADGSFSYTPNANFHGTDSFTYFAHDGSENSNSTTVTITVTSVNDLPVAANDTYATSMNIPLAIAAPGVLGNDTDADGDAILASLVSGPSNGLLLFSIDGSYLYTPNLFFVGTDTFSYRATDLLGNSNVAVVTINVGNNAPNAANDSYSVNEDNTLNVAAAGVLANDTDADGNPLSAVLVSGPANVAAFTLNADGSFNYTPSANFNGTDSFTYRANDGTANSNLATVTITVNNVNDAPVAGNDSYSVNEDNTLNVAAAGVLANDTDADGDPLTAILVTGPTKAAAFNLNADGSFSYTPNADFNGFDSFTYRASDGALNSNLATVTITVNSVNDAPVAANSNFAVTNNQTLTILPPDILLGSFDADGDVLTLTIVSSPLHGTLTLRTDGSLEYRSNGTYTGPDSFTYQISDGNGGVASGTVTIEVAAGLGGVAAAPEAPADSSDSDSEANDGPSFQGAGVAQKQAAHDAAAPPPARAHAGGGSDAGSVTTTELAGEAEADPQAEQVFLDLSSNIAVQRVVRNLVPPAAADAASQHYESVYDDRLLWGDLIDMQRDLAANSRLPFVAAGSVAGATGTLTVGYVLWMIRGGWLVTSMLAQMPAWQLVDPMAVLDYLDEGSSDAKGRAGEDDDDSLESMLEKKTPANETKEETATQPQPS
ncbi:MAG: tandem-95 repeat protein [Pirellulales bacterium]